MIYKKALYNHKTPRRVIIKETILKYLFFLSSVVAFVSVAMIFLFLLQGSIEAFKLIDFSEFTSGGNSSQSLQWNPTGMSAYYSMIPLMLGSLLTAIPAVVMATLIGVTVGIYLSEIANFRVRELMKPLLELFAGIPTVVLGFFMLAVGANFFQEIFNSYHRLNSFIASVGLSLIIVPVIASLTEESLQSVASEIRNGAYALGATKWQTFKKVVFPSALNGIGAGIILSFGRAVGETMIVLMVSGNSGEMTFSIFKSVRTLTATIAAEMGEVTHNSEHYYALFVIGILLFILTFCLNLGAEIILAKFSKRD